MAVNIVSGLYKQLYSELTVRYTLMAVNIVSGLYKQLYHQTHCEVHSDGGEHCEWSLQTVI